MRTNVFNVCSDGAGTAEALSATEALGRACGLERKQLLRLRLLAEELFGMLGSIAGRVEADYTAEENNKRFSLCLKSKIDLNKDIRRQLLSVSSSGENAAAKSFMGKIRDMVAEAMLPEGDGVSLFSLGMMSMGSSGNYRTGSGAYKWSLQEYRSELENSSSEDAEAREAWDELEKSIVASIADDVSVSIVGSKVEIIILKAFN